MNIDVFAKEIADVLNTQSEQIARVHKPNNKAYLDSSYSIMGYYCKRSVLIELEAWGELRIKFDCDNIVFFRISKKNLAAFLDFFRGKQITTGDVKFDQTLVVRLSNWGQIFTLYSHRWGQPSNLETNYSYFMNSTFTKLTSPASRGYSISHMHHRTAASEIGIDI